MYSFNSSHDIKSHEFVQKETHQTITISNIFFSSTRLYIASECYCILSLFRCFFIRVSLDCSRNSRRETSVLHLNKQSKTTMRACEWVEKRALNYTWWQFHSCSLPFHSSTKFEHCRSMLLMSWSLETTMKFLSTSLPPQYSLFFRDCFGDARQQYRLKEDSLYTVIYVDLIALYECF